MADASQQAQRTTRRVMSTADDLQATENRYYAQYGRYTSRLADLVQYGGSKWMREMTLPVALDLDVSSDGKTLLIRADGATVSVFRVLKAGDEIGGGYEIHRAQGG